MYYVIVCKVCSITPHVYCQFFFYEIAKFSAHQNFYIYGIYIILDQVKYISASKANQRVGVSEVSPTPCNIVIHIVCSVYQLKLSLLLY